MSIEVQEALCQYVAQQQCLPPVEVACHGHNLGSIGSMTSDCRVRGPHGRGAQPEQAALAAAGAQVAAVWWHRLPCQHHGSARSAAAGRGAHAALLLSLPQTRTAIPQQEIPLVMQHVQYKGDASTCHRLELANVHAQHLLRARVDSPSANA